MRPTKYRIWDKERKIWKEDYHYHLAPNGQLYYDGMNITEHNEIVFWTGLHDNHNNTDGEELYDLDIVELAGLNIPEGMLGIVVYDTNQGRYKLAPISAYLQNAGNGGWTGYDIRYAYEKVGNVLSHPHLLKGEGTNE